KLTTQRLRLAAALVGERHRHARVAVHPPLDVERRMGVAGEHEQAQMPSLQGVCLNGRVQAQVEELPENRVRLTVQVPSHDVHHAVEHAASDLAQSVKVPGFRKGKVPQQVLVQKVGRERLMTEAIESHIGGWFWNAAAKTRVRPIAQPEYEFELPTADDEDWEFSATFPVPTRPELPDWRTLEVGAIEPEVPDELVQQELDALR